MDIDTVREKVIGWLLTQLTAQPVMRATLSETARKEYERLQHRRNRTGKSVQERIAQITKELTNVRKAIRAGGPLESLVEDLKELERMLSEAHAEHDPLEAQDQAGGQFPGPDAIDGRLGEILHHLARTSLDFADLLRRLLPVFVIRPVQALDCPAVRPRANLTLRLDAWCKEGEMVPGQSVTLDLFEHPEQIKNLVLRHSLNDG